MLHAHFPFSSRSSLTCVNRRPWRCHCYPENPNSGWPNNFGNGIVMIIWLTLSLTEKNVWITNIKFIYLRIRSHYSSHLQGIPHHPIVLYTWKSLSIWTVNCDVKRGIIFFWCFCMNDDSKHWIHVYIKHCWHRWQLQTYWGYCDHWGNICGKSWKVIWLVLGDRRSWDET